MHKEDAITEVIPLKNLSVKGKGGTLALTISHFILEKQNNQTRSPQNTYIRPWSSWGTNWAHSTLRTLVKKEKHIKSGGNQKGAISYW